jgi:hypothetical protein
MNLTNFFRLITGSIFQGSVTSGKISRFEGPMDYSNTYFYCPRIFAKDGFNVSLQVNKGTYCESTAGYRKLSPTFISVEFGFPSEDEELMHKYSEMFDHNEDENFSVVGTIGNIPIEVMEEVFKKHGGIDWDKTVSEEWFNGTLKD